MGMGGREEAMDWNGKRIMVTSCGGLGDLVMFTPALRRWKEKFPSCHLSFLCRDNHRAILEGLPYVDRVVCIYRGRFLGRYRAVPFLPGLDAIVFTDWHPVLLPFAAFFRVPVRAGYAREGHRLSGCLTRKLRQNVFLSADYAAITQSKVLSEALETPLEGDMTRIDVAPSGERETRAVDRLLGELGLGAEEPYLLLTPFAGMEERNWPLGAAKEFVGLAEARFGMPVVVAGPPGKGEEASAISRRSLAGKTGVPELMELVRRAALLVTPDSGPMHIAGAVGTKCVALFSKDLPSRWAPKRNCRPVTLGMECSPCDDATARACSHVGCMRGIDAAMVMQACDEIMKP